MLKEDIINDKFNNEKCYICNSYNHRIAKCYLISYRPNQDRLIQKWNYS